MNKRGVRPSKIIPEESEQDDVSMRSVKTEKQSRGRGARRAVTPAPDENRVEYESSGDDDDQSVLGGKKNKKTKFDTEYDEACSKL